MRMRLPFQLRVLLGCLAAVLLSMWVVSSQLETLLSYWIAEEARDSLRQQLVLVREVVRQRWKSGDPIERSEALAQELGRMTRLRATLIDPQGRVLGDSDLQMREVEALESHAQRPEVIQALSEGVGESVRYSSTLGSDLLYAALPLQDPAQPELVIRLAMPLSQVQASQQFSRGMVARAVLVGFLLSLIVAYLAARGISRPVRRLTKTAQAIAAGDLSQRIRRYPRHEMGELARSFDSMADSLVRQMREMAHAHERQEAILRGMVEGVLLTDSRGRILLVNQSLLSLLGLKGDPVGKVYSDVLRMPGLAQAMEEILQGGRPRISVEIRSLGPPPRFLEAHLARLEGRGEQSGAVAVLHDVTERKRVEQMRRDFVANTSHELRTPLAAIKGAAETLRDGALESHEHAMGFVEMILRQSSRLERLGEDLLSLASLENAEAGAGREKVKIMEMAASALATVRPLAEQRGVQLALAAAQQDLAIKGDARQLEQALINLLDNAVKYNNLGGKVTVSLTRQGGEAIITVADTGPGIPAEHLPRIFERFYRVDKNRSREQGGTGLGLAIVKHVAQAHGGRVEVSSRVGQGSQFSLVLPLQA